MKKLLFVFLAMTMAFAMVGCGDDPAETVTPPPPLPEYWKITYNSNGWYDSNAIPADVEILKGTAIGDANLPNLEDTRTPKLQEFIGWATTAGGYDSTTIDGTYKPTANTTLYVIFDIAVGAPITIKYDRNGFGTGAIADATGASGTKLTATQLTAPTAVASKTFKGWAFSPTGAIITNDTPAPRRNVTLYAIWTWEASTTNVLVPTVGEKLFLENGAYAVYKFSIPVGAKWEDYRTITAQYAVDEANANIGIRGRRVLGPYYPWDFEIGEGENGRVTGIDFNEARYIELNNWGLNQHILDNNTDNWVKTTVHPDNEPFIQDDDGNDTDEIDHSGDTFTYKLSNVDVPVDGTYFTLTYNLAGPNPGGNPHGNFNAAYYPADDYNGDIYFAIGLTAGYDGGKGKAATGITQLIKEITLVPITNAPAAAVAIKSTGSGFDEPTFVSYADPVVYSVRAGVSDTIVIPGTPCDCGDEDCECINCEISATTGECQFNCCKLPIAIPATADYTVDLAHANVFIAGSGTSAAVKTTNGIKNATAWSAANGGPFFIALNFPKQGDDQLDIRSYEKYTVKAKFYQANGTTEIQGTDVDTDHGNGYFRFRAGAADNSSFGANIGGGQWNINFNTVEIAIPAAVAAGGPNVRWIAVQNGDTNTDNKTIMPAFVEIIEIKFFKATE